MDWQDVGNGRGLLNVLSKYLPEVC